MTTIAGVCGSASRTDGIGTSAYFSSPSDITIYAAQTSALIVRIFILWHPEVDICVRTCGTSSLAGGQREQRHSVDCSRPCVEIVDADYFRVEVADTDNHRVGFVDTFSDVITKSNPDALIYGQRDTKSDANGNIQWDIDCERRENALWDAIAIADCLWIAFSHADSVLNPVADGDPVANTVCMQPGVCPLPRHGCVRI